MEKTEIESLLLATPMQESMVFSTLADPGTGHCILQLTFELHGEHSRSLLQDAWQTLLHRHMALRTQFVWKRQEKLRQLVRKRVNSDVEFVDLGEISAKQQTEECERFLTSDKNRGLALDKAPLTRLSVLELGPEKKYCVWAFHHSVVDGWSIAILFKDLCAILTALTSHSSTPSAATVEPLEKLVDHIRGSSESAKTFWQLNLANTQQHYSLAAIEAPRCNEHSHCIYELALDAAVSEEIYAACRAKRITFASLALAGWSLLLAYYSGRDEVLFGSISNGRGSLSERGTNTVGLLISLVPIHVTLDMQTSLDDYLSGFQRQHMLRNEHEHLAPTDLANILNIEPGTPLFDSMLVVENHPGSEQLSPASLELGVQNVLGYEQSDTPLAVSVGTDANIVVVSRFHGDRFSRDNIAALVDFYFGLLSRMAKTKNPMPLADLLPSFKNAAEDLIAHNTNVGILNQQSLVELFNEQTTQHPNRIALHYQSANISYAELADHAEAIRLTLFKSGVCSGDTVAVYMDRSPACIASMLAILALDACYLPLDPAYPPQRLEFMLHDSGSILVLCVAGAASEEFAVKSVQVPELSDNTVPARLVLVTTFNSPDMCLIYTSGSTGQPKGVKLRHDSVLNRCQWMWSEFPFKEAEVCCHRTPLGFVDSVCEIFSPLCQGAPIVIVDSNQVRDLNGFINILSQRRVSRITLVPSVLAAMLDVLEESSTQLPMLQLWCSSGEPLPRQLTEKFQRLVPDGRLLNLYGSTEVAADALFYEATTGLSEHAIVPIGRPITATRACVLNARGQPLPTGVHGELCIGGTAVARGYHDRSEETAAKFLTQQGSENYYRSGDLAMQDSAGIFHFRGRLDRQLKIRGQRVEPGEVESLLREHPDVSNVVVFQTPYNQLTAAFTTGNDVQVTTSTLREKLEKALPSFSLPQQLIQLDTIPLNSSGKVDYAALQALCLDKNQPLEVKPQASKPHSMSLPQQAIFSIIQNIWQELLPDEPVRAGDNFFQLGGQSLMAMRMIARVERRLGVSIPLPTLMNSPLLADFAAAVCEGKNWSDDNELLTLKAAKGKPGLFCVHGDAFNLTPHFSGEQAVYWLSQWPQRMLLTKSKPSVLGFESIEDTARNYLDQVRAAQPKGPYYFIAGSAAAIIVYEMAQQLLRQGEEPAALLLMDLPQGELQVPTLQGESLLTWPSRTLHRINRRFGPSARQRQLSYFHALRKLSHGHSLTDLEARNYTNGLLFKAVSKYEIKPYSGTVVYIVSQSWVPVRSTKEYLTLPTQWQKLMPGTTDVHIAPALVHNDLLQGESAKFIADLCAEIIQ